MFREHKLQMTFRSCDDSTECRVLSYLLDRDRLTATAAREKVQQALAAWLAIDELEANKSELTDDELVAQLGTAIATLQGRLAYCQSLLSHHSIGQYPLPSVSANRDVPLRHIQMQQPFKRVDTTASISAQVSRDEEQEQDLDIDNTPSGQTHQDEKINALFDDFSPDSIESDSPMSYLFEG